MKRLTLAILIASLFACANNGGRFGDIGPFQVSGFEWETGYGHSFADSYKSKFSGDLEPAHGNHGASTFNLDRSFDRDEDRIDTSIKFIWSLKNN